MSQDFINRGAVPAEFLAEDRSGSELKRLSVVSPYVGEFIGTFMLVLTVCFVSFYHNSLFGCTAIGFVLMVLIYSIGPVSGAHLNPAVSLMLFLLQKVDGLVAIAYIFCQILGGLSAGGVAYNLFLEGLPFGPTEAYGGWQAAVVEVAYTFMLCFVVANVAASKGNNPKADQNCFYGLAIGFVVIAGAYGGGSISGGCFNPAVSLGLNIPFHHSWWALFYCLFQAVGALLATLFAYLIRAQDRLSVNLEDDINSRIQALCEFLGAFMLVLTVGLNLTVDSPAAAWSISAALMCMIYALGDISGGHFNPAVTLAIFLCSKDPDKNTKGSGYVREKTLVYVTAQMMGGLVAGLLYESVHCSASKTVMNFKLLGTAPVDSSTWEQVAVAEVFFTFVLVFTVLSVAVYTKEDDLGRRDHLTRHKNHAALAIGLCVMAGGGAIGNVSGGHLNPAVSMGVSSGASLVCRGPESPRWANCLLYMLFQMGGSVLAAVVYFATHPDEFEHMDEVGSKLVDK